MRLSRTSLQTAVAGVALGTGMLAAGTASAGMLYELRLSTNATPGAPTANVQGPTAAGTYTVNLWERISGSGANDGGSDQISPTSNEALNNTYLTVQSSGVSGTPGNVTKGTVNAQFQGAGIFRNGTGGDLNTDGVNDWGSTSADLANTAYMFARGPSPRPGIAPTYGNALAGDTFEFKVAAFTVSYSGTGAMTFRVTKPNALLNGASTAAYSAWYEDAVVDTDSDSLTYGQGIFTGQASVMGNDNAAAIGAFTNGIGIKFGTDVIPEPASIGLIGAAAVGLLGRRRRS